MSDYSLANTTNNMDDNYIKMDNNYIKMDDNYIINKKYIRWIRQMQDCLEVCVKSNGCSKYQTHRVCTYNNYDSYMKLNATLPKTPKQQLNLAYLILT